MKLSVIHALMMVYMSIIIPESLEAADYIPGNKECHIGIWKKLYGANCFNQGLEEVPQNISSDILILILEKNKISRISNSSFSRYKRLQVLFLRDNPILTIEEGAFEPLKELGVLNMIGTGSRTLPKSIFALPNLTDLYLTDNLLTDAVFETKITAPLEHLRITNNKLKKIPQFGLLPTLGYLNLSGNSISTFNIADVASYCSLKLLDLTNNPIRFLLIRTKCDCVDFIFWARARHITFISDVTCEEFFDFCAVIGYSNKKLSLLKDCEDVIPIEIVSNSSQPEKVKLNSIQPENVGLNWICTVICVFAALVGLSLAMYTAVKNANRETLNTNT